MNTAQQTVETVLAAVAIYAALGFGFALAFVFRGVDRIDPAAAGASWRFRLTILPGSAALWPLLLSRWIRGAPPPEERTSHRRASKRRPT